MMRFVLSLALAVCSVVNAGEVPYVSGLVDFAPVSNNGSLPFYWDLGSGQGLLVGGGDYIDVQQDGWRIEAYDTTGSGELGSVSVHWLQSGIQISSSSGARGAMRALLDAPVAKGLRYATVQWEYDGTPCLIFINGRRFNLPAKAWPGNCGGEVFGGWTGTARVRTLGDGRSVEVIIWPIAGGADIVLGNVTFN